MPSIETVITRWLDTLHGRTDARGRRLENLGGSNVYGSGRTLYSYGFHFPLAEYYPAGLERSNGRQYRRDRALFLLNSDRVSNSTTRHQSETRAAIGRRAAEYGAEILLLPFSALESARIVRASIRPLEIRPDAQWEEDRYADRLADVPTWHRTRTVYGSADTLADVPDRIAARGWDRGEYTYAWRPNVIRPDGSYAWQETVPREPEPDGRFHWTVTVHRMGDSVFTADVQETRRRHVSRPCTVLDVIRAGLATARNQSAARRDPNRRRPARGLELLSDPLALLDPTAPVDETWTEPVHVRRRFVSSFDTNEPAPLYFLATLPSRSRARTVETALEDLAPPAVHAAMARGRDVIRQGDIFAIATDLSDSDVATFERARLTLWTRENVRPRLGEPGYVAPLTAADRREVARRARTLWRREWRRRAEPRGPVTVPGARRRFAELERRRRADETRARAGARSAILGGRLETRTGYYYSAGSVSFLPGLADARRAAEYARDRTDSNGYRTRAHSRDGYRRPFGGPSALELWRDCYRRAFESLRPAARSNRRAVARERTRALLAIHGTSHSATEVARGPGGTVYIRGTMRHVPGLEPGRLGGRDHRPIRLGDGARWYLAIRNTVPRNRDGRRP